MREMEGLADVVVMTVKSALAPVLERLAVAESRLAQVASGEQTIAELRERLVVAETKAAMVPPDPRVEQLDRRVEALEATPKPDTVSVDVERTERALVELTKDIGAMRERVAVVEVRATDPRFDQFDRRIESLETKTEPARTSDSSELERPIAELRERLLVLETKFQERSAVPGPPGPAGQDGKDGVGFDDLQVVQIDERNFVVKAIRGDRAKDIGSVFFPVQMYRGVWSDGAEYVKGDSVTWAGSEWHCNEPTTSKPGDGSKAWTLKVKRGRDGRDGKDAPGALPVVTVGAQGA